MLYSMGVLVPRLLEGDSMRPLTNYFGHLFFTAMHDRNGESTSVEDIIIVYFTVRPHHQERPATSLSVYYRPHHSTETAMLRAVPDALTDADSRRVTLLGLLDM